MQPHLDRLDMRILSALQLCNQTTAHQLAEQVPLSPSAIQRRIRNYRSTGVIAADISVLDPKVAGEQISVVLLIQLAGQGLARAAEFRTGLSRSPQVQVVMDVAGPHDLLCIAVFDGMEVLNAFIDMEIADHPSVARFETIFVRRRVKFGAAIPL